MVVAPAVWYWTSERPSPRTVRSSNEAPRRGHTSRVGGIAMAHGMLWRGNALKAIAVVALAALIFTGCETVQGNPKTAIGGLGGATVGGLIAAAAGGGGGIAAGVIGGALLGGLAGNLLDERDKRMAARPRSARSKRRRRERRSRGTTPTVDILERSHRSARTSPTAAIAESTSRP